MKRSSRKKKKEDSVAEGKNYVNFVEAEFEKQMQQRMKFEQKYLKLDKATEESYRQEHLNLLREQAGARFTEFSKNKSVSKGTNTSGPEDAEKSPSGIKRIHKLSEDSKIRRSRFLEHDLSLKKQYEVKLGQPLNHGKVQTERSVEYTGPSL